MIFERSVFPKSIPLNTTIYFASKILSILITNLFTYKITKKVEKVNETKAYGKNFANFTFEVLITVYTAETIITISQVRFIKGLFHLKRYLRKIPIKINWIVILLTEINIVLLKDSLRIKLIKNEINKSKKHKKSENIEISKVAIFVSLN